MPTSPRLYLDWNATTPPAPEVVAAMQAALAGAWANPSSVHGPGRQARALVEDAREAVAALVGLDPRDVLLTGGGTEANNLALEMAAVGGAVVLSRLEHPSVGQPAAQLASRGIEVIEVPVAPDGRVTAAAFAEAMGRAVGPIRLVVLQAVNHETGVVQPVSEVAELAHAAGALLHCDAVQAVGKLSQEAWAGADTVAVAAHKIRGPKGIGALLTRPGLEVMPVLRGGAQERGVRPGTLDPVGAAGFAVASKRAASRVERWAGLAVLRDELEASLLGLATGSVVHGAGALRVAHVTNVSFPGWRGPELVAALDLEGVSVSSGSACSAGTPEPSPVIGAMAGAARAASAVRFSLGEDFSSPDLNLVVGAVRRVLARGPGDGS